MILSTFDELKLTKVSPISAAPDGYHPAPPSFAFTRGEGSPLPQTLEEEASFNNQLMKGYDLLYDSPQTAHDIYSYSKKFVDAAATGSGDDGVDMGEQDIASKFSIQRRFPPKFFVIPKKLPEGEFSDDFDLCLQAYVKRVASLSSIKSANPLSIMLTDHDPFDTNQGFPTYSTNPELRFSTAAALSFQRYEADHIIRRITEMSTALGFDQSMIWPAAIAKRSGPTHKPILVYRDHADGYSVIADLEATGYYTRGRQVFMMPFYFNMLISAVALPLKMGRLSIPGFSHDANGESQYLPKFTEDEGYEIAESDLSAFDTTITPALRKRLWHWCRHYGFNPVALDLLEYFEQSTMIFSAPYNSAQKGSLSYVMGRFGLLSGLKVTTEVGSAISAASTLKAYLRAGVITKAQLLDGSWPLFLMLGDDTLLKNRKGAIKADIFEKSYAEEGLKVKYLVPGKRFLMNHIKDGKKYGVCNRVIQQTLFNEDAYTHVGQLRLGLASRLTKEFLPHHWTTLKKWAAAVGPYTKAPDVFEVVVKASGVLSAVKELATHPSVDVFLQSAAGESWLSKLQAKQEMGGKYEALLSLFKTKLITINSDTEQQRRALVSMLFNSDPRLQSQSLNSLSGYLQGRQI